MLLAAEEDTGQHFSEAVARRTTYYLRQVPANYGAPVSQPDRRGWRDRVAAAVRTLWLDHGYLDTEVDEAVQQL